MGSPGPPWNILAGFGEITAGKNDSVCPPAACIRMGKTDKQTLNKSSIHMDKGFREPKGWKQLNRTVLRNEETGLP